MPTNAIVLPAWFQWLKEIAPLVAAALGLGIAVAGLGTWWRQLKGNAEYELSRRLLRAAFRTRGAIRAARNPIVMGGEVKAAVAAAGHATAKAESGDEMQDEAAVYQARWTRVVEAMSDVDVECVEAEVIWGQEARQAITPLKQAAHELGFALSRYLKNPRRERNSDRAMKEAERVDCIVFAQNEDVTKDPFSMKVAEAVEAVECLAKPHLRR